MLGRYLFILLTFGLSGAMHIWGDMASGLPWHESGVVHFFCVQTLGIALEDGDQAAYEVSSGGTAIEGNRKSDSSITRPRLWKRIIGYVWVAVWMAWSVPL